MTGGGAAMPEAVATKLQELCGLTFVEGYGLTETMAPTHVNPPDRPKKQCLGIPICDTESMVVDPVDAEPSCPIGEVGEIVVPRPADLPRLLGQARRPRRKRSSSTTAASASAPATSGAATRRATSSSSIA